MKKYLIYTALLLCIALMFLRFLWTWVMPGALVLAVAMWLTRKRK